MKTIIYILIILLASAICSCRSVEYVSRETIKHDTTYINKLIKDSIYLKDSVYIHSKNDTVFVEKYKYQYIDKVVRDTSYVVKSDTISVPYPVEKRLTRWQQLKLDIGGISIGIIIITILVVVGRAVYFLKK